MTGAVKNADEFWNGMEWEILTLHDRFRKAMKILMTEGMRRLTRRTPVNTGSAVMSYVASSGTPSSGGFHAAGKAVEATNPLALGAEALRPAAESVAFATLNNVNYSDPYQTFYITNNAPHIGGLEAGELPYEPLRQRSPGGMFGITLIELSTLVSKLL